MSPRKPKPDSPERKALSQRLQEAVDKIGGRSAAAELTDRSPSAISQWTHAQTFPDLLTFRLLAKESGFSADYLLGLDAPGAALPVPQRVSLLENISRDHEDRIEALEESKTRAALSAVATAEEPTISSGRHETRRGRG